MLVQVKDIVKKLQEIDQDIYVFTSGYEGGYCNPSIDYEINSFALNINDEWYFGPHEKVNKNDNYENANIVLGIVL